MVEVSHSAAVSLSAPVNCCFVVSAMNSCFCSLHWSEKCDCLQYLITLHLLLVDDVYSVLLRTRESLVWYDSCSLYLHSVGDHFDVWSPQNLVHGWACSVILLNLYAENTNLIWFGGDLCARDNAHWGESTCSAILSLFNACHAATLGWWRCCQLSKGSRVCWYFSVVINNHTGCFLNLFLIKKNERQRCLDF